MIRYREYDIKYNEGTGGVTVYRNHDGYGTPVAYKNSFSSLEDGLVFIAERIAVKDNSDIMGVLNSLRTLKSDLKSIIGKLIPSKDNPPKEQKADTEKIKKIVRETSAFSGTGTLPISQDPPKKIIKKIIKKG